MESDEGTKPAHVAPQDIRCPDHPDLPQARSILFDVRQGQLTSVVVYDKCRDRITGQLDPRDLLPTLGQLKQALAELDLPDDTIVVMAKDADGNQYSPFAEAVAGHYLPHSGWSGEITDAGEPGALPAVILEPVN